MMLSNTTRSEKLGKKILGENDVEAVLQRLDRLTREEAQTTATQALELVYGLVKNIKVVMDGARSSLTSSYAVLIVGFSSRRKRVSGWCLSNSWHVFFFIECALANNSGGSTHTAARERHKQIETCVLFLCHFGERML
jgi:hypothetical protein